VTFGNPADPDDLVERRDLLEAGPRHRRSQAPGRCWWPAVPLTAAA